MCEGLLQSATGILEAYWRTDVLLKMGNNSLAS